MSYTIPPTDANLNKISQEISYTDLCSSTSNFSQSNALGKGTYGSVYKGLLKDGTEVAIKVLPIPKEGGFVEEVEVLSKFRHPNLVILMGFGRNNKERFLVYEYLSGGDVSARILKSDLTWKQRLSVLLDASLGLSHLHNSNPQVFHRDIKTQNILLDRNGTAKMADFGLACYSKNYVTDPTTGKGGIRVEQCSGTIGYADPIYIETHTVTEASEVYSFGMVILEMLCSRPPALQANTGEITYSYKDRIVTNPVSISMMIDPKLRWPVKLADSLLSLALHCAWPKVEHRPQFVQVVCEIRRLLNGQEGEYSMKQIHLLCQQKPTGGNLQAPNTGISSPSNTSNQVRGHYTSQSNSATSSSHQSRQSQQPSQTPAGVRGGPSHHTNQQYQQYTQQGQTKSHHSSQNQSNNAYPASSYQHTNSSPQNQYTNASPQNQQTRASPQNQYTNALPQHQHTSSSPQNHQSTYYIQNQHTASQQNQHNTTSHQYQHSSTSQQNQHTNVSPQNQQSAHHPQPSQPKYSPQVNTGYTQQNSHNETSKSNPPLSSLNRSSDPKYGYKQQETSHQHYGEHVTGRSHQRQQHYKETIPETSIPPNIVEIHQKILINNQPDVKKTKEQPPPQLVESKDVPLRISQQQYTANRVEIKQRNSSMVSTNGNTPKWRKVSDSPAGECFESLSTVCVLPDFFADVPSATKQAVKLNESLIREIMSLGFTQSQAESACKKCANVQDAVDWIFANSHA